jgi:FkbM family methyltransferase
VLTQRLLALLDRRVGDLIFEWLQCPSVPGRGPDYASPRMTEKTKLAIAAEHDDVVAALEKKIVRLERKLEKERLGRRARDEEGHLVVLDYPGQEIKLLSEVAGRRNSCAKEPFTVSWIERSLRPGDVLYDIGANVGAYSMVAAAASDDSVRVFSFEPGYATFAMLCDHIALNDFERKITPIPVPLGARTGLERFHYRSLGAAGARHHLGPETPEAFEPLYEQQVFMFRLDDLIAQFDLPLPTLVKLDVDGAERDVLTGANRTLRSDGLRSVLVEIDKDEDDVSPVLLEAGFSLAERWSDKPRVWYGLFERP